LIDGNANGANPLWTHLCGSQLFKGETSAQPDLHFVPLKSGNTPGVAGDLLLVLGRLQQPSSAVPRNGSSSFQPDSTTV